MNNVILRSAGESLNKSPRQHVRVASRGKKIVSTFITILLAAATLTFGLGITGTPESSVSQAYASINGCGQGFLGMDPDGPDAKSAITASWGGAAGNIRANFGNERSVLNSNGASVNNSGYFTAYEWYGVSGFQLYHGTWFEGSGCSRYSQLSPLNMIAGLIQAGTNFFGGTLLSIISLAMDASVVKDLIAGEDSIASTIIGSLQNSLYLEWLIPIIILAGAAIAYSGLVKKRGSEAVQGTIWVILSAALAMVFFAQPTQIASWADETVVTIGNQVMAATSKAASGAVTENDELCRVDSAIVTSPTRGNYEVRLDGESSAQLRTSQCVLWRTFLYEPWAAAQFGALANNSDILVPEGAAATFKNNRSLPLVFIDNRTLNRAEVVTDTTRDESDRIDQWQAFKDTITNPDAKAGWANFSGNPGDVRLGPTLLGFVGMLAGLAPITFLSVTLVVQQIFMLLLLLIAPIVFTIGIFPGQGRRIMLGWFEIFLSTLVKRFIAYVLIALLLVSLTVVMSTNTGSSNFLLQVALVAAIGFGTLFLRKIILERFGTVSLGGDGGNILREAGKGTWKEAKEDANKVRGIVTRPVAEYSKAVRKDESRGKAIMSAVGGIKKGYQKGGPSITEAASGLKKAYNTRDENRTKAAVKEAAKKEAQEKAEFDARAKVTEQRQNRKANERIIKGNARLNNNLENNNFENNTPKRPNVANVNAPDATSVGDVSIEDAREGDYSASFDKMQQKLDAIELRKEVLEDWKAQLDNGVASGEYDLVEARERKNIIQNELYGLYEESEILKRKLDSTE